MLTLAPERKEVHLQTVQISRRLKHFHFWALVVATVREGTL
jgi:hypothetical protein